MTSVFSSKKKRGRRGCLGGPQDYGLTRYFIGINLRSCIHNPKTNTKTSGWWKMGLTVVHVKKTWDS